MNNKERAAFTRILRKIYSDRILCLLELGDTSNGKLVDWFIEPLYHFLFGGIETKEEKEKIMLLLPTVQLYSEAIEGLDFMVTQSSIKSAVELEKYIENEQQIMAIQLGFTDGEFTPTENLASSYSIRKLNYNPEFDDHSEYFMGTHHHDHYMGFSKNSIGPAKTDDFTLRRVNERFKNIKIDEATSGIIHELLYNEQDRPDDYYRLKILISQIQCTNYGSSIIDPELIIRKLEKKHIIKIEQGEVEYYLDRLSSAS